MIDILGKQVQNISRNHRSESSARESNQWALNCELFEETFAESSMVVS